MNLPFFTKPKPTIKTKPALQSAKQQPKKVLGKGSPMPRISIRNKYLDIITGDLKKLVGQDEKSLKSEMEHNEFMETHFPK